MKNVEICGTRRLVSIASICAVITIAAPRMAWAKQPPVIDPTQKPENSAPITAQAAVVFDNANLHPVFKITAEQANRALNEGRDMAKRGKTEEDVMKKWRREAKVTRGKKGTVSGAVWCRGIEANTIICDGLRSATLYEKPNTPDFILSKGGYLKELVFAVSLTSHPKISETTASKVRRAVYGVANPQLQKPDYIEQFRQDMEVVADADAKEVKVIKFVLSDDKNNYYEAISKEATEASGTVELNGVRREASTVEANSNANTSGSVSGSGGFASASATTRETSTYTLTQYVPFTETNPYYRTQYTVVFPLFDKDGKARIKPDANEILLHIITETGEQTVSYKLPQTKK